ncbi:MAG: hypothetical protein VKL42_12110 [Snowella sp.]|nr:hypothetical protein [Snowella sp.]
MPENLYLKSATPFSLFPHTFSFLATLVLSGFCTLVSVFQAIAL